MANYNHQPFSDWLLDEASLTAHEQHSLQEHLQTCEACRNLSNSLREMDYQLGAAPVLAPVEGFRLRWLERQQVEQARLLRKQRRQTFTTLLLSIGGAMLLFFLLAIALLPVLRAPQPIFFAAILQATRIFSVASELGNTASALLRVTLGLLPPSMWVAISVAFGGLCALWIIALQHFTSPRRVIL